MSFGELIRTKKGLLESTWPLAVFVSFEGVVND